MDIFIPTLGFAKDYSVMTKEQLAMNFWGRVEQAQQLEGKRNLKYVCHLAGVPYQTVINQKSAARLPSLENSQKLASILNCSIDWLLLGNSPPESENEQKIISLLVNDARKKAIATRIASLSQSELFAIEVFLGIRK